ncbi:MAG TPA: peptidoglycan DD-metalloendopeptidase family protein [Gaiellaceae bacterium]|nr:peptidoglycan DD-metalloendopeptidase family protein [Gaiellaceae bacterium]
MARRLLPLLALALVLAAPAAADDIHKKKASVDSQLAQVQAQIAVSKQQEAHLAGQVTVLTHSIDRLEQRVGDVSSQLSSLRADIHLHRLRLAKLDDLLQVQTKRYRSLRTEYRVALQRLEARLVSIYKDPAPSTIDVVLAAKSFQDVLTQVDYLGKIAQQDKHVAAQVAEAKKAAAAARRTTKRQKHRVFVETQVVNGRAQQVALLQSQLLSSKSRLSAARGSKADALAATRKRIQDQVSESQALQAASAALAAQLRGDSSATAVPGDAPQFIWPVSGPITSPFGMRWGTLHPGIDIGVPTGTPVHAAAAGKVVWCGWETGYGNFVVVDHGGGYATAYGHNSRIEVSCGEHVAQGQVLAYSGCTGFCTGPHVHFEVRVNGDPVDPLGYLG